MTKLKGHVTTSLNGGKCTVTHRIFAPVTLSHCQFYGWQERSVKSCGFENYSQVILGRLIGKREYCSIKTRFQQALQRPYNPSPQYTA